METVRIGDYASICGAITIIIFEKYIFLHQP